MDLLRLLVMPLTPAPVRPVSGAGMALPPAPPQAAAVTLNAIGPQQAEGSVPVNYTTSVNTDAQVVLHDAAAARPQASQFGGADPAYTGLGPVSLTVGGSNISLTLPDGLLGSYKIALLPTGGGDADVAESPTFALDTMAPALSGIGFSDSGSEGVNWAFTSDEAGTWRVSLWPQGTNPTPAEIASGTGAVATITGACTGGEAESGTFAALGAGTYQPTIWVKDDFDNGRSVIDADVTVVAASSGVVPVFLSGSSLNLGGSPQATHTLTLDLSGHDGVGAIVVMVGGFGANGKQLDAAALDGQAGTVIANAPAASSTGAFAAAVVFPAGTYASSATLTLTHDGSSYSSGVAAYSVPAGSTVQALTVQAESTRAGSDVSGNVSAGDGVIAAQQVKDGVQADWTGVTEDFEIDIRAGEWFSAASAGNVPAANPLTIIASGTNDRTTALSVRAF